MSDDRLRLLVERIERIEGELADVMQDRADVYAEAKAVGYDAKVIRQVIKRRKMKPEDRSEGDAVLELYEAALGMTGAYDERRHGVGGVTNPVTPAAKAPTVKQRQVSDAIALAQISRMNRGLN